MSAKRTERFIERQTEGSAVLGDAGKRTVIVDAETGVNYLFIRTGYGVGITPLYNADGTLIVTKTEAE